MPKHQQTILPLSAPLDLEATLLSGQCFSWLPGPDGTWRGWMAGRAAQLWTDEDGTSLRMTGVSPRQARSYFCFNEAGETVAATFPNDPHLTRCREGLPGLRLIRDDSWECLCNFLCSSQKQITQIIQLNHRLRLSFESHSPAFPSPEQISGAGEAFLRECRLGYRARYVAGAADSISRGRWRWQDLDGLDTDAAARKLCELPGVGPKIAHCVLLYGLGRLDAFPVDVWMKRVLHHLYFPRQRHPPGLPDLVAFGRDTFGPCCGVAQLFLFHGYRTGLLTA